MGYFTTRVFSRIGKQNNDCNQQQRNEKPVNIITIQNTIEDHLVTETLKTIRTMIKDNFILEKDDKILFNKPEKQLAETLKHMQVRENIRPHIEMLESIHYHWLERIRKLTKDDAQNRLEGNLEIIEKTLDNLAEKHQTSK